MRASRLSALVGALFATSGWSNPVMDIGFFAEQVPGTRHVQLTWLDSSPAPKAGPYLRDGKAYAVKWKPFAGYKADQGSGVEKFRVTQACDCNVPAGKHTFRTLMEGPSAEFWGGVMGAELEVVTEKGASKTKPQGLDCRTECAGGATSPLAEQQPPDTAVHREETISTGWLVLDGRFLRPPYALVLDDYKLTVNGQLVQSWPKFSSAKNMTSELEHLAVSLRASIFSVKCEAGAASVKANAEQAGAWLKQVDEVVKGKGDRKSKLEQLKKLPKSLFSACAARVLDRWDGYP